MESKFAVKLIETAFDSHRDALEKTWVELSGSLVQAAAMIHESITSGGKILIAGNGGSAADAQHMAAEIVGRFSRERPGFPAIALTCDTSILTAVTNDYGFDHVFRRQVEALGRKGDTLILLSTSGNSDNLILAAEEAARRGMRLLCLLGKGGGELGMLVDETEGALSLVVPSAHTPRIQEMHSLVYHILCDLVEERLASEASAE